MPTTDQLKQTETNLRALLHQVFSSFDLQTFDELVDQIVQCIEVDVDLLVYVREKARFSDRVLPPDQHFLKFSFLAFNWEGGILSRFTGPKDLTSREKLLTQEGYSYCESELCRVYFRQHDSFNFERCLNLTMRIVVAFYINSGSLTHFRESVSARFISDFFREFPNGTVQDVISFIERLTELNVTLWHQKDEMFFRSSNSYRADDLLESFPGLSCALPRFHTETKFLGDLKTSVLRRNQTFGADAAGEKYYVIRTFSGIHFSKEDGVRWGNFHTRQKAVAIYTSKSQSGRIRMDEIMYANSLIEKFLSVLDESQQSDVIFDAERRCFAAETLIAENPLATKAELLHAFLDVVSNTFSEILKLTFADTLILWIFDPFNKVLQPVHVETLKLPLLQGADNEILNCQTQHNHIAVHAFNTGLMESVAHPLWISTELEQLSVLRANLPDDRTNKSIRLEKMRDRRAEMVDSGSPNSTSAYAIPVRRGNITVGVLEAVSEDAGRLTYDTASFERLAAICGDTMRRLEMANDRAWLSRMSFVHAARHRIEELLREVENRVGDVGSELVEMIKSAQVASPEYMADEGQRATQRIHAALKRCGSDGEVDAWMERLTTFQRSYGFSSMMNGVLADIVETLAENKSHGRFSVSDLALAIQEPGSGIDYIVVLSFIPPDSWLEPTFSK